MKKLKTINSHSGLARPDQHNCASSRFCIAGKQYFKTEIRKLMVVERQAVAGSKLHQAVRFSKRLDA